jgi:hypothetical protein
MDAENNSTTCLHCHGPKDIRNPTGTCDHLFWPDNLTAEAKRANGYVVPVDRYAWLREAAALCGASKDGSRVMVDVELDPRGPCVSVGGGIINRTYRVMTWDEFDAAIENPLPVLIAEAKQQHLNRQSGRTSTG